MTAIHIFSLFEWTFFPYRIVVNVFSHLSLNTFKRFKPTCSHINFYVLFSTIFFLFTKQNQTRNRSSTYDSYFHRISSIVLSLNFYYLCFRTRHDGLNWNLMNFKINYLFVNAIGVPVLWRLTEPYFGMFETWVCWPTPPKSLSNNCCPIRRKMIIVVCAMKMHFLS